MGPRLGHNRFIQMAEESYLPAFQSIQNIVHAFGSVSMMVNKYQSQVMPRSMLYSAMNHSRWSPHSMPSTPHSRPSLVWLNISRR